MIEPARRAIAVKVADIDLVAQTGRIEQPVQLLLVLIAQRFRDAVGAETLDAS